jgi:transcriptional regulator with XRE-family HTH domain
VVDAPVRGALTPGMSQPTALGAALVDWRRGEGLSRLAASRRLGVTHTTLRTWEVDGVCPSPIHLSTLAGVLGGDVDSVRALAGPDRVRTPLTSGGRSASPLCRARLAAGLTMTQLAGKVGVAPSTISRWENGVRAPTDYEWARLAARLGLDPGCRGDVVGRPRSRRTEGVLLPGLGRVRRAAGLTQSAFRTRLGIGQTVTSAWENGRAPVPVDRLADIAGILGIEPEDLRAAAARPGDDAPARPLADLRRAARLTQRELAHHLGVTTRTIGHWEAGTRPVPFRVVRPLSRCLRRPVSVVLAAAGLELQPMPRPHTWQVTDLPAVLAGLRRSSGWSAAALGRRLGVTGQTVRAWEAGTSTPGLAACGRLELIHGLPGGALGRLLPPGRARISA